MGQQSSKSSPTEQATARSNERSSLIARESDVNEEFGTQPEKRRRIMDEQSMVVCDQEQGSPSNSQLTCHLDWLSNNPFVRSKIVILKEKLDLLFARQHDILTELEHAEIQPGQRRRAQVQHWLNKVQEIKYTIRSMIKDSQGTCSNSNPNPFGCIESFIKKVDELIGGSKFSNGVVLLDHDSARVPLLLDTKPVGTNFQQNTEVILRWLQNREHCIIGVYGMGGVGKTTLLRHIHDQLLQDAKLSYNTGHVYWVTVSENWSVHKLQEDIAKVIGLKSFQDEDKMKKASILHDRLAARGRTVLFLDDMWEQFSGETVGIPLDNGNCKVILSTRSYDVCRKMGCKDFVIKAKILHEKEAWDLFVEKLGNYDTLDEKVKKIAWDVAKECGGLPLAVATVARSMTWVDDMDEWRTVLNDLKSARGQHDMEKDVFQILRFSYDRLKDKRVQECFLSCILYGEDERIRRTTLVDLWINEGLLDEWESRDEQVAKGCSILNKLENSCLLESFLNFEKEKCVKMHDLIRDMAIIITQKDPVFMAEAGKWLKQVPKEDKWRKDLVKVSLSDIEIEEIPSGMAPMTPSLTLLMLDDNMFLRKIPESFFVHMRALKVLNLSRTAIERVPESVSDLKNLRGLLLSYCPELVYVPSVAKLIKLRTLDLVGCYKLKEAPKGLETLKSIEKLGYMPWDVSDLIGFNNVVQRWTSLSSFIFWIRDPTFYELPWEFDELHDFDKVVSVIGGKYGGNTSNIVVPATLEYLSFCESEMEGTSLGDVFQPVGEAKGLKYIFIKACRGLEYISGSSGTQQGSSLLCNAQLEMLSLSMLPDLRSISKSGAPICFAHLRDLEISECPKLKVGIPVPRTEQLYFPNLESITVTNCEEMKEIFESTMEGTLSNPVLSLPRLNDIRLENLPKIKVIFPFTEDIDLPNLEFIKVSSCEEVEEIFGSNKQASPSSNPMLSFSKLDHLELVGPSYNPILCLPKLQGLQLLDLPELSCVYRGILHCPSLFDRNTHISNCLKHKWWILAGAQC